MSSEPTIAEPTIAEPTIAEVARAFGERPEISARTVVVTIFGDSVVPAGGEIWLGDLIAIARPFGFSDRLTRTSVGRLTSEGWLEGERIGRRSRYRLTTVARDEFARAEQRIYHAHRPDWDGEWTLAFVDVGTADREQAQLLGKHLTWRGFGEVSPGVLALPGDGRDEVADVSARLELTTALPTATARFDDLDALVASGGLRDRFGIREAETGYRQFLDRYTELLDRLEGGVTAEEAFLVRTMVVHDLRRTLLTDPWLPADLLPVDWPGDAAHELAGRLYHRVDAAAWDWLEQHGGLERPGPDHASSTRFR